ELGGAWVKFESGATVSKVSFPSDYKYSTIIMENLPANTSRLCVIKLLAAAVTTKTPVVELRILSQREQNTCSAIVKSGDISSIERACSKLNSLAPSPGFKASIEPIKLPASQSPYQVHCRKVHCAWNRPTRRANLVFGDKTTALSAYKHLEARECNILGSNISASYPYSQKDQRKWVVKLEGLSDATNEQDIIMAIPKFDRPQTVHLGEPSYVPDPDRDSGIVKSMLLKLGPLEQWSVSSDTGAKRFNAYATFLYESSARDAVSTLKDTPLSFNETTKLSVALVASAQFKIQAKVYNAVSPQIDELKTVWMRQRIGVSEILLKYPFRMLKLECEDHKLMVQAKTALEKVVSGQIVKMDGKDFRFGNFRQNGTGLKHIKLIEDSFKVVIIPDMRKSQFRVFGPEEYSQSTLDKITTMLQDCTPEGHTMASGKGSISEMECPSCLCELEDPIRMSCGHIYCSDCFIQMCEAEKTATKEFRIRCVKATDARGSICQKPFSLSEIQEHLPVEAFEAVLEKSFESYISRHPGDFTYCQTPDCNQVYRNSPPGPERPDTFTCKQCLVSICTFCHTSHPGKPCDEAKRIAKRIGKSILSDETKKALGIKSCPNCSMLMEKRDGCNHMTCKCGAHVCWVCLMSFNDGEACYTHMTKAHGGY
ncbi:hypothetical protein TRIATDRAFT_186740, partial [Trichoderma atroviride IMI 206040]